jgi:hypothetical protein
MTTEQIKSLQQAIGTAAWKLNLDRFAEVLGQDPEHDYVRSKFREFNELANWFGRFDPETLLKLIEAGVK